MNHTNTQTEQEKPFAPTLASISNQIRDTRELLMRAADESPVFRIDDNGHKVAMGKDEILEVAIDRLLFACADVDELQTQLVRLAGGAELTD